MSTEDNFPVAATTASGRMKFALFVSVVCVAAILYWKFGHALTFEELALQESRLKEYQQQHPFLIYALAFLVYVAVTGLSLPGATVLTLLFGWYFGFVRGVIVVSISSTAGATLAFLFSRFLFRDSMLNRFGDRLKNFNQSLEREGPFFLFSLRLIPAVPFFVINTVMGLTPIRATTFWWVSQIGMLPGTAVYVYAGSIVPNLQVLADDGVSAVFTSSQLTQILVAFVILGLFPFAVRGVLKLFHRSQPQLTVHSAEDAPSTKS